MGSSSSKSDGREDLVKIKNQTQQQNRGNSKERTDNDHANKQPVKSMPNEHDGSYKALKDCIQNINKSGVNTSTYLEWCKNVEKKLVGLKKSLGIKDESSEKAETTNDPEQIRKLKEQLQQLQEQRQQLLTQISEVAGIRLKNNNPGIADLSDEHRPAKIAEKFSELYDNEWTNAVECLKGDSDDIEKDGIQFLFDIVTSTYIWCREKTAKHLEDFTQILLFNKANKPGSDGDNEAIYENVKINAASEVQKRCKEIIRKHTANKIKEYEQEYRTKKLKDIPDAKNKYSKVLSKPQFIEYVDKCVSLSWHMNMQDPPVEMDLQEIDKIDKTQYRAYTRSGKLIDFVVWPALVLHFGGPLLYKGVAQFCKAPEADDHHKPKADYDNKLKADCNNEPKPDYGMEPNEDYDTETKSDYDKDPKADYDKEPKADYDIETKEDNNGETNLALV